MFCFAGGISLNSKYIFKKYFSSLFQIMLAIAVLYAFSLFGLYVSKSNIMRENAFLIATGLFLLVVSIFYLPMIVYYFRVRAEIKQQVFCCKTIVVRKIQRARFHNYYYRGGGLVDEGKSILFDEEGNKYYFIGGNTSALKDLSFEVLKITYLPKTGFLNSVELEKQPPDPKTLYAFTSCFYFYLSKSERDQLCRKNKRNKKHMQNREKE